MRGEWCVDLPEQLVVLPGRAQPSDVQRILKSNSVLRGKPVFT